MTIIHFNGLKAYPPGLHIPSSITGDPHPHDTEEESNCPATLYRTTNSDSFELELVEPPDAPETTHRYPTRN